MYAVNELVPSTLIAIPIWWFQKSIIEEERTSMQAQNAVRKLQRRQDELLDALLPSAIVEHMRKGEGVLFDSQQDAAVLFVYVAESKRLALEHDTWLVLKWLSEVYAAFDDVLRQEFKNTIIKI